MLWYQCIGFGVILLLTWINQWADLSGANLQYCLLETAIILAVWGIVFLFTRRLVTHLQYLNGLLRVCAWCRKISYQDDWIPMEEYFARGFNVLSTHGICPGCAQKVEEDTKRIHRLEIEKKAASAANAGATKYSEGRDPLLASIQSCNQAAVEPSPGRQAA